MKKTYLMTAAIALLAMSGCNTDDLAGNKIHSSGYIDSKSLTIDDTRKAKKAKKAKFNFRVDDCDDDGVIDGKFKYHDKAEKVKIKGSVTSAEICTAGSAPAPVSDDPFCFRDNSCGDAPTTGAPANCPNYCDTDQLKVEFDYKSHSKKSKKSKKSDEDMVSPGTGYACVTNSNAGTEGALFNAESVYVKVLSGPHEGYDNTDTFTGKKLKVPKLKTCNDNET